MSKPYEGEDARGPERGAQGAAAEASLDTGEARALRMAFPEAAPLRPLRRAGLMYTPLTQKALRICFDAHAHERDKSGLPYVIHPLHVAEQMETEAEVCAALLHDVVENSGYRLEDLRAAGFPEEVLEALRLLTRDFSESYLAYVARLRLNPIARRVKLADLSHNSDEGRLLSVGEEDRWRKVKYRMAQAILLEDAPDPDTGLRRKTFALTPDGQTALLAYYGRDGRVASYALRAQTQAGSAECAFDARQGERLRRALDGTMTLPEALSAWCRQKGERTGEGVAVMLKRAGIAYTVNFS